MKFILLLNALIFSTLCFAELTTAGVEEPFVCNPPSEIRNRVNENCIAASDNNIDYPKEQSFSIPNGKVFFTSITTDRGQTRFQISHKCNGQQRSQWTTYNFCGYQKFQLDRISAATRAVRAGVASENNLTEDKNRAEIDRLTAQIINAQIADPMKNMSEENGVITIQTLHDPSGTTCYGPQTIRYEPRCSR